MKRCKIGVLFFLPAAVVFSLLLAACFSGWTGDTLGETAFITINLGGGTSRNATTWTGTNIVDEDIPHTIKIDGKTVGTGVKIGDNPTYQVTPGFRTVAVLGYAPADGTTLLSYAENVIDVVLGRSSSFTVAMSQAFEVNVAADWTNTVIPTIKAGGNNRDYYIFLKAPISIGSSTATFGGATGVGINIRGNSITLSGTGRLLDIGSVQTVILEDTDLVGIAGNTEPLVYVNGGNFDIQGSASVSGNTFIAATSSTDAHGGGVYVNGGTFTMRDSTSVYNNTVDGSLSSNGGGVFVCNGGIFTMKNNATVYSNMTAGGSMSLDGGGVYVISGTFYMEGGTIQDNTSGSGAGVYLASGVINMSGGTIKLNIAGTNGGGVHVAFDGTLNMSGGTITSNEATGTSGGNGGGVLVDGNFYMTGGTISYNRAPGSSFGGGGVFVGGRMVIPDTMAYPYVPVYPSGNNIDYNTSGASSYHQVYVHTGGEVTITTSGGTSDTIPEEAGW